MCVVHECNRAVAPGCRKYCRQHNQVASSLARRHRRDGLKARGVPSWERNGWGTAEKFREYQREYMRRYRARRHDRAQATTVDGCGPTAPAPQ